MSYAVPNPLMDNMKWAWLGSGGCPAQHSDEWHGWVQGTKKKKGFQKTGCAWNGPGTIFMNISVSGQAGESCRWVSEHSTEGLKEGRQATPGRHSTSGIYSALKYLLMLSYWSPHNNWMMSRGSLANSLFWILKAWTRLWKLSWSRLNKNSH